MSYDPKRRDPSWQMVQPGCFIDPAGCAHIFPDEILAFLRWRHPEAGFNPKSRCDYDLVVETYTRSMRELFPDIEIRVVVHERVQN